ncbi:MAG: hypothetical protein PHR35_02420 [Kiritimatiellae bacterium]|nr:hypothetical protein [Kiritimatiellia bacterium]
MNIQRWMWIDLIGFDNTAPDYAVNALFRKAGFVPQAVSLLLQNPDFVHTHDGIDSDLPLPADCCSYGSHPFNETRKRQAWTQRQLKGLVDELRRRHVAAYVSVFDSSPDCTWLDTHPEIRYVKNTGERSKGLFFLKRFRDGSTYEDFFVRQLLRVMRDYGFDGYHMADGFCPPRLPLCAGDFSDDMVEQFLGATEITLPSGMPDRCEDRPEAVSRRADWVWREHRAEWIGFHARRHAAFCRRLVREIHAAGSMIVANTVWTKDPLETLYRYGVDIRAYAEAGLDGFIAEAGAAALETIGNREAVAGDPLIHSFMAAALLTKACVGLTPLLWLNGVQDIHEQWNALRHAPTCLEREILHMSSLYLWSGKHRPSRCVSGPLVCLADNLRRTEWAWLNRLWRLGFASRPNRLLGLTLVCSRRDLDRHLDDFIRSRRWPAHRLAHRLLALGAPILAVADPADLGTVRGAIVVFHPHLMSPQDLALVLAHRNGPILLIDAPCAAIADASVSFEDDGQPEPLACAAYGVSAETVPGVCSSPASATPANDPLAQDPASWLEALPCQPVSEGFLRRCADLLIAAARAPRVTRGREGVLVLGTGTERVTRLLVSNDNLGRAYPRIEMGRAIAEGCVRSEFPCMPLFMESDTAFSVMVPGRGITVVDVTTRRSQTKAT